MNDSEAEARSRAQTSPTPLVSVVILSYNRPSLLVSAIDSVLAQTYPELEVLVIDNRSPASAEVARLVHDKPRAKLIANPENLGFTGAMNQGLALARGQYVHLTEDDIVMEPTCLQHLVDHLEANQDVALVSGIMLNPDGTIRCAGGTVEARFDLRCANSSRRRALRPDGSSRAVRCVICARGVHLCSEERVG